jgi:hypothetical protein
MFKREDGNGFDHNNTIFTRSKMISFLGKLSDTSATTSIATAIITQWDDSMNEIIEQYPADTWLHFTKYPRCINWRTRSIILGTNFETGKSYAFFFPVPSKDADMRTYHRLTPSSVRRLSEVAKRLNETSKYAHVSINAADGAGWDLNVRHGDIR